MQEVGERHARVASRMRKAWGIPVLWDFSGPGGICGQRWNCSTDGERYLGSDIPEDYLIFSLHTGQIDAADVRLENRSRFNGALPPGSWMLVSAQGAPEAVTRGPFSLVHLYLPAPLLSDVAAQYGLHFRPPSGAECLNGAFRDNPMAARTVELVRAIEQDSPLRALQIDLLCQQIVGDLLSHCQPAARLAGPERLAPLVRVRVDAFIDARLTTGCTLDDLAAEAGLSRSHFLRAFKGSFGRTPMRELQARRLQAAHRMVQGTRRPLSEIADELGYADQSHMTRSFRAGFGVTPAELRRVRH